MDEAGKLRKGVALASTVRGLVHEIRKQARTRRAEQAPDAETWLRSEGWTDLEPSFRSAVVPQLVERRLLPEEDVPDVSGRIVEARIGEEYFRWQVPAPENRDAGTKMDTDVPLQGRIFYLKARAKETFDAIAGAVWSALGASALVYDGQNLEPAAFGDAGRPGLETAFVRSVRTRAEHFLKLGRARGILLNGPPGTGKSRCVRTVLGELGLNALHVQLSALDDLFFERADGPPDVDTMLRILRPDALVIDDVDRVQAASQPELLALLEIASAWCKLVFVTTNDAGKLIAPLVRPGRLDDLLEVPPLEREVILELLGAEDMDLAEEMAGWPICYIRDFVTRREALGRTAARAELGELARRVALAAEAEEETSEDVDRLVAHHHLRRIGAPR